MMSEKPENRMPLSQPARSVAAAPPAPAFGRAFGGRVDPPRRPGAAVFDEDAAAAAAFAGFVVLAGLAAGFAAFEVAGVFDAARFAEPFAASAFGVVDLAEPADAVEPDAAEPFPADVVAASGFEAPGAAPGRPGTAGRRGTPEERGGRGASGCIAPPHRPGKENGGGPTAAPVTRSKPFRP